MTTTDHAKADEHYVLKCRECAFTYHVPGDCLDPPLKFSVDADHVRLQCVYGEVFTVTLGLGEFFSIAPTPPSGLVLHASIADNMKPLHAHMMSHFDPLFLLVRQTANRTDHEYKSQPEGPTYVRISKEHGVDVVGDINVSKAEIPGVSW